MPSQDLNFGAAINTGSLKESINGINAVLSQLDRVVSQNAEFIPLINQFIKGSGGKLSVGNTGGLQNPVNIIMNIATPDAGSFRMSQGQVLAEAVAAITRASRRNI